MVVIATNAPLHPLSLQRLARRAGLGLARTGSTANNGSGEIFLAKTLQIGWAVKINHGDYIVTIYGHLNHFIVKVWQNVTV